jgi:predicted MFS family arabinose efflux permease
MPTDQMIDYVPDNRVGSGTADNAVRIAGIGMFILLLATYSLNAMDRQIFPLLLNDVRHQFGFSLSSAGLLSTVFTFGMACAGLPTGWLMAHLSRRATVQIGIVIFSAATVLTALAPGFWTMMLCRGLTGIGEAMQLTALLAIAGSYFAKHRSFAVGAVNTSFGIGAIIGPALGGVILASYHTWHAPMFAFGALGFIAIALIAIFVRPWLSEAAASAYAESSTSGQGSETLLNRHTILLSILSLIGGLIIYGYLGMYPSFLRTHFGYSPQAAGNVMAFFGFGVLASVAGGAIGDRLPARVLLPVAFLGGGAIGFGLFHGPSNFAVQAGLSFLWGLIVSGTVYVNLAAYHVKAVAPRLAARSSGIFVTTLYASSSVAGYVFGALTTWLGWTRAADLQIVCLCLAGALLAACLGSRRPAS